MANIYITKEAQYNEKAKPLYVEYKKKKRINTRLVRASWKRVFVTSIIYGISLSCARFVWFQLFGKPTFFKVEYEVTTPSQMPNISGHKE